MIRQRCKEALVVIAAVATALPASPACGDHGMDIYTPWVGHGNNPGPTGFNTRDGDMSPSWRLPDPAVGWGDLDVIDLWGDDAPAPQDPWQPLIDGVPGRGRHDWVDPYAGGLDSPTGVGGAPLPIPVPGVWVLVAIASAALGARRRPRSRSALR